MINAVELAWRAILRLYPKSFRDRYGKELLREMAALSRAARRAGWITWVGVWLRSTGDLLASLPGVWRREWTDRSSARSRRSSFGAVQAALRDTRHALRSLKRSPLFSLVVIASTAVGIAATTAALTLADRLLVQSMPGIPTAKRVVELGRTERGEGFDSFSHPDFVDVAAAVPGLERTAAYAIDQVALQAGGEATRSIAFFVSPEYFTVLGVGAEVGLLSQALGTAEDGPTVVLTHRAWVQRFGADPSILGRTVAVNRLPHTVIGVTASGFRGHMVAVEPDLFLPLRRLRVVAGQAIDYNDRESSWHLALGLRAAGSRLEDINEQLAGVAQRLASAYPSTHDARGFSAVDLGPVPGLGRGAVRIFVGALLVLAGAVLVIACANVAGMIIARGVTQARERAIRIGLGATRWTIVRGLVSEVVILFALGGVAGASLGGVLLSQLEAKAQTIPFPLRIGLLPEPHILWMVAGLVFVAALGAGLLPALVISRRDLSGAMRVGKRDPSGPSLPQLGLASVQVAMSMILLSVTTLFGRSLLEAKRADAGFDAESVVVADLDLSLEGYDEADGRVWLERLLTDLRSTSGTVSAAAALDLPLDLVGHGMAVAPPHWDDDPEGPHLGVQYNLVSPEYFTTLGMPVLAGREFELSDDATGPPVAVVSQRLARRAWPAEDPLGRQLRLDDNAGFEVTVVGVVPDIANQTVGEVPEPLIYLPLAQQYAPNVHVIMRSREAAPAALQSVASSISRLDPQMAHVPPSTLRDRVELGVLPHRLVAGVAASLSVVALLLAAMGVFGVVSLSVAARTQELGIRRALGATRGSVVYAALRRCFYWIVPGVGIGLLGAGAVGAPLESMLIATSPLDGWAMTVSIVVLMFTVGAGAWFPASYAARVDPADALRRE